MRNGHGHRIGGGLASRGVPDLQDFRDGSACRLLPRPACHCFRNDIEEGDVSLDVSANNGIANGVERDLGAFLLLEQRFFHELAVDGMPQRSQQSAGVDLALDETALRAFLQSLFGHGLVFQAREHHQRDAVRGCAEPAHRFKSLRIGQPQIEQNDLNRMLRQVRLGLGQALHVRQFGFVRPPSSSISRSERASAGLSSTSRTVRIDSLVIRFAPDVAT